MNKLSNTKYFPRYLDDVVKQKLTYAGAVEIRGPKWCGKTQTALQVAASSLMMQNPDELENNMTLASTKPSLLLQGKKPRLIDEWQDAPQLWDAVRFSVDQESNTGLYLLTGSATPVAKPKHSGAGRIVSVDMLPMSLSESKESTKEVSLGKLFSLAKPPVKTTAKHTAEHATKPSTKTGDDSTTESSAKSQSKSSAEPSSNSTIEPSQKIDIEGHSDCDIEKIAHIICRGGWPRAVTSGFNRAGLNMASDYVNTIANEDISRADGKQRNPQYARLIMGEYARCTSTLTTQSSILKDLKARDIDLSKDTVNAYIGALRNLHVIQDLSAWTPSLHARSRITKTPTKHFACPSIAAACLGASPELLLKDASTLGMLFESLCIRDLRVYANSLGGQVFHYHDSTGMEADAVVVLPNGSYALFEVKLGGAYVEEGAANLKKLCNKINKTIMGEPAFCAVITPGGYAFTRDDGVLAIPISCMCA